MRTLIDGLLRLVGGAPPCWEWLDNGPKLFGLMLADRSLSGSLAGRDRRSIRWQSLIAITEYH